jgi:hypothetical protein
MFVAHVKEERKNYQGVGFCHIRNCLILSPTGIVGFLNYQSKLLHPRRHGMTATPCCISDIILGVHNVICPKNQSRFMQIQSMQHYTHAYTHIWTMLCVWSVIIPNTPAYIHTAVEQPPLGQASADPRIAAVFHQIRNHIQSTAEHQQDSEVRAYRQAAIRVCMYVCMCMQKYTILVCMYVCMCMQRYNYCSKIWCAHPHDIAYKHK